MTFAIILLVTTALCFALRNPIMKHPVAFYVVACAFIAVFTVGYVTGNLPRPVWMALFQPIQKALVPLALFVVVMYIGLLPRTSKPALWLRPIRAELSILACLLVVAHIIIYAGSYLPRLFNGSSLNLNMLASFAVAIILFVLLLVLGITSFQAVKKRMDHDSWKKLQKFAYLFFILVYAHLLFILLPAALRGGIQATESVIVYSVVFLVYIIGRPLRGYLDKRNAARAS